VDAIAPALIGLGLFLMYEAYKNQAPTPLTTAKTAITGASSKSS
jgi:hypothetical protein